MHARIYKLLNIKPAEHRVVKQLFFVQFSLGIATAFLFTSTLTIFLHTFEVQYIPKVYLFSAFLLLVANLIYSKLEHRYHARKLLQVIIIFSGLSLIVTWAGITVLNFKWLPFLLSAWNLVVFTLVGYAFWGMAAVIFNVRQSKRLFSVVGSGDIPAKLIGYALVPVLIPYVGVNNLFWISVFAFATAYYYLLKLEHEAVDSHVKDQLRLADESDAPTFIKTYFHNRLIFNIALFSLIAFTIFALIDYTLLVEVKSRFQNSPDLAVFIGVFFAVGRILAIFFKLLFSSRVISQLGLANSLLISPLVLLLITSIMLLPGESERMVFYTFGIMVLLSEVLKSAVQEPAFFVLFQPLEPYLRLKGHLIAKGYMLPFSLLASGLFLLFCDQFLGGISILFIAQVLVALILIWITSIYLVKKQYLRTLIGAIRKGWFTGTELFLNDAPVREMLLHKSASNNPKDIILSLKLLERSGYLKLEELLREKVNSSFTEVRKFALTRLILLGYQNVLPLVQELLQQQPDDAIRPVLYKAYYYLIPEIEPEDKNALSVLDDESYRNALVGLLLRTDVAAHQVALAELENQVNNNSNLAQMLLALDILYEAPYRGGSQILENLMNAGASEVYKRAIETIGKLGEYALLKQVISKASEYKAWYALQKSLVLFGDDVFAAPEVQRQSLPPETTKAFISAAGKVKGEHSTRYLLNLLSKDWPEPDDIIEALWLKQAVLRKEDKKRVCDWLELKLSQGKRKIYACVEVRRKQALLLLAEALEREIKQDLQKMLKAFALCYDRQQIDRVMKLLQIGETGKVANAIEILEHLIPKRYFLQTDLLLDFIQDVPDENRAIRVRKKASTSEKTAGITKVLAAVISDEQMHCSVWTRSVACYLVPLLGTKSLKSILATGNRLPEEPVFQETKDYVLSILT